MSFDRLQAAIRSNERQGNPSTDLRFVALARAVAIVATSCGGSGSGGGRTADVVVTMKDIPLSTTAAPDELPIENGVIPRIRSNRGHRGRGHRAGHQHFAHGDPRAGVVRLVCNLPKLYEAGRRAVFTVA
jgi:hypothetical protein